MTVHLDVNGVMSAAIGDEGLTREEVDALAPRGEEIARLLQSQRAAGELPIAELPRRADTLKRVKPLAAAVREECDTLVVLGIGGSALGARAVVHALGDDTVRVIVADNIDPWSLGDLLDHVDLSRCTFNVVSRSGETPETMAQFLIVRDLLLRTFGAIDYKRHLIVTTNATSGALRQIVNDEGFRDLLVPDGVAGRFSVLTDVALFPAAVAGVNVDELLLGAAWMDTRTQQEALWDNPAQLLAVLLYLAATRKQKNVVVCMPYSDRLEALADWFVQLWAESLAKTHEMNGSVVHTGQTPVAARGATDQHAQLQLLLDGPQDKVVLMLRVADHGREIEIPAAYADLDGVGYLGGGGLGALMNMEQRATELALHKRQRMASILELPEVSAFALGQLLYLLEMTTVFAAALYRVNPFDQPAVEEARRFVFGLAGRKGWETRRVEVEEWLAQKSTDYIR